MPPPAPVSPRASTSPPQMGWQGNWVTSGRAALTAPACQGSIAIQTDPGHRPEWQETSQPVAPAGSWCIETPPPASFLPGKGRASQALCLHLAPAVPGLQLTNPGLWHPYRVPEDTGTWLNQQPGNAHPRVPHVTLALAKDHVAHWDKASCLPPSSHLLGPLAPGNERDPVSPGN